MPQGTKFSSDPAISLFAQPMLALEPRFMFDAAGVATAADAAEQAQSDAEGDAAAAAFSLAPDDGGAAPADDGAPDYAAQATGQEQANTASNRHEIVIVDSAVENYQELLAGLSSDVEVIVLGADADIAAVADALQGRTGLDAVHLITHGDAGQLTFGGGNLTLDNLDSAQTALSAIGQAMAADGDILLYGCYVGADGTGQAFLDAFAQATGADVAASNDATGAAALGGDWDLERSSGQIEAGIVLDQAARDGWNGLLATTVGFSSPTLSNGNKTISDTGYELTVSAGTWSSVSTSSGYGQVDGGSTATVTLVRSGGGTFEISSLKVSDQNYSIAPKVTISGYLNGQQVGTSKEFTFTEQLLNVTWDNLTLDNLSGQTVDEVRLVFNAGFYYGIDDIVVTNGASDAAPTLTADAANPSFTENGSAVDIFSNVSVGLGGTDTGQTITGFTFTVSNVEESDRISLDGSTIALITGSGNTTGSSAGGVLNYSVSVAGSTATVTVTSGAMTTTQARNVIDGMTYSSTSENPSTAARTVTVTQVKDTGTSNNTASVSVASTVSVSAVNDTPTIGGTVPGSFTVSEDVATNLDFSGVTLGDVDAGNGTISVTFTTGSGKLTATSGGNVSVSGNDTGTLTLTGNISDIDTYLNTASALQFTTDANSTTATTVSMLVNDGGNSGSGGAKTASTGNIDINVTSVNDAPVVTATGGQASFTDQTGAIAIDNTLTLADVDNTTLSSATVSITANFASGQDVLSFTNTDAITFGNITGSYDANTGVLTLTSAGSTATVAQFQNALRAVTYNNSSGTPNTATRTISFAANDGSTASTSATRDVTITLVNDAPAFTNLSGGGSFTEGGSPIQLDGDVTVSDAELGASANYAGSTLTLARQGGANATDVFAFNLTGANFTVQGGDLQANGQTFATFTNTGGTLTISFTSTGTTATAALVNEVMQRITYANNSDDPPGSVNIAYSFSDGNSGAQGTGGALSASGTAAVTITGVSDAPTLAATGQNPTFTEGNAAPGADLFSGVIASTVEAADRFVGMTITITNISDGASENLRFDGSDVALTQGTTGTSATNGLSYSVSVTGSTATLSFTGGNLTAAQFQTLLDSLAYRNISDNPTTGANRVVTITGITDTGSNANGGSNAAAPNLTSTVTLTAVNDAPVLGNLDGDGTALQAGTSALIDKDGNITVTDADSANFNGGSLSIVQNSGGANGSFSLDGTNATSGGDGAIAAGETIMVGGVTIGTVHIADDGQSGHTLTIAFDNTNATAARVQTLIQNMRWGATAGSGAQAFTLTLNDGDGGTATTTAGFTMTVGNAPTLGNLSGDSVTFNESGAVFLDNGNNAALDDTDNPASLDGGKVTVAITAGGDAAQDILTLSGNWTALSGQTAGSNVSVNGTVIGTLANSIAAGNNLVIDLNANATVARVQALVRALAYDNHSEPPGTTTRTVSITVTDNDGIVSTASNVSVTVQSVNDAPTGSVTGTNQTFTENGTAVTPFSAATFSTVETGQSISGLVFTLQNAENTDRLLIDGTQITMTDGASGATATNGVTYTVSVAGGTATLTLSGATLTPNAAAGLVNAVAFSSTSDNPSTTARTLTLVSVTDNGGGTDTTTISTAATINVTPVNDAPVLGGGGTLTYTAGTASVTPLSGFTVSDPDNGSLTSATVSLTTNFDALKDNLSFQADPATMGNISGAYNAGQLTLTSAGGTATLAQWQAALRAVSYTTTEGAGGPARTIAVVTNDGTVNSQTATVTLSVAAAPVTSTPDFVPPPTSQPTVIPPSVSAPPPVTTAPVVSLGQTGSTNTDTPVSNGLQAAGGQAGDGIRTTVTGQLGSISALDNTGTPVSAGLSAAVSSSASSGSAGLIGGGFGSGSTISSFSGTGGGLGGGLGGGGLGGGLGGGGFGQGGFNGAGLIGESGAGQDGSQPNSAEDQPNAGEAGDTQVQPGPSADATPDATGRDASPGAELAKLSELLFPTDNLLAGSEGGNADAPAPALTGFQAELAKSAPLTAGLNSALLAALSAAARPA